MLHLLNYLQITDRYQLYRFDYVLILKYGDMLYVADGGYLMTYPKSNKKNTIYFTSLER